MIQHFENSHGEVPELSPQRLSTGSIPEGLLQPDTSRCEVRLGRSESLKGREELRRSRRSDPVPRSRSDVDMDPGNSGNSGNSNSPSDTPRLHSASSSASSLSNRSLENPTPPYTPKMGRSDVPSDIPSVPSVPINELLSPELFSTEFSHLRILRVLDLLFYQGLRREQLLSREELGLLFPNLPDLIGVHSETRS
ncbi:hypothetical protein HGM15179_020514 [Zosterops borbonicus]|uniref:DH domain-containing protein n=1 Tax=Zosterops borbonicus TaxID=364589 RepID=A0A8K1FU36_9PASS|nr:hypothetical protein HGM15179_020514 [Zosterops borbonicus]